MTPPTITVPATVEYLLPVYETVPLQLIAYYSTVQRGSDVDNPRNLAKAVLCE